MIKGTATLIKPVNRRSKSAICQNMFRESGEADEIPAVSRQNHQSFDFVGPSEFRSKLMRRMQPNSPKVENRIARSTDPVSRFNQTGTSKNPFGSTIGRNTMLSSMHQDQQLQATKQSRQIDRYEQYQQAWEIKKDHIRKATHKKSPVLMDNNIKHLYVHENEDKVDVINDFIVNYWEMSLRNHHPILQRHIKGHRFEKVEKEKMLQLREGTRKIQNSIPALPVNRIALLKKRQLSLSGRNKIRRELENTDQTSIRNSMTTPVQEEVLKINYDGDKKWMGSENL